METNAASEVLRTQFQGNKNFSYGRSLAKAVGVLVIGVGGSIGILGLLSQGGIISLPQAMQSAIGTIGHKLGPIGFWGLTGGSILIGGFLIAKAKGRASETDEFPKTWKTSVQARVHPLIYTNWKLAGYFDSVSIEEYRRDFKKHRNRRHLYDIHEVNFQNFAIRMTQSMQHMTYEARLVLERDPAMERLIRARNYAIGSRSDIGWDGSQLDSEKAKEKNEQLKEHAESCTLYHWTLCPVPSLPIAQPLFQSTSYFVVKKSTEECVIELSAQYQGKKIGWLNMANAHHTCGVYNIGGGSQEEMTATHSDAACLLGMQAYIHPPTWHDLRHRYYQQDHIVYDKGFHIPPGGNYFAKTSFIGNHTTDAYMIACAFADFRPTIPGQTFFFNQHSTDRGEFFNLFGGVRNQKALEERLKLDMRGVCRTAIAEGITVLVLGASGCGAFLHDPVLEAKLWREVLETEFKGCFEEVVFAILPGKNSATINAFQNQFPKPA